MIPSYYLFLFPLLAYSLYFKELHSPVSLNLTYLSIPLAAYLAQRYRWQGFIVTVIAGLLLPFGIRPENGLGSFPAALHVYLTAVLVAWFVAKNGMPDNFKKWLASPVFFGLALVILPIYTRTLLFTIGDDFILHFRVSLSLVLYFIIFAQGIIAVSPRLVIGGLLLAALGGFFLDFFELPLSYRYAHAHELPDHLHVIYGYNNLDDFLVGVVCYLAGNYYGTLLLRHNKLLNLKWLTGVSAIIVIAVWLAGFQSYYGFGFPLAFRSFYLILIASLYLGMVWQARGVFLAVFVAIVSNLIASFYGRIFALHEPLYAMAFGIMGVMMYEYATGKETRWSSSSIYAVAWLPALALLIAGFIGLITEHESRMENILAGLATITVVVLVIASILAIRELLAWTKTIKRGRVVSQWGGIALVCGAIYALITDIYGLVSLLVEAKASIVDMISAKSNQLLLSEGIASVNMQHILVVASLLCAIILLATIIVRQFRTYDKIIDDLHELLGWAVMLLSKILEKLRGDTSKRFSEIADRFEKSSWGYSPTTQRVLKISELILEQTRNLIVAITFFYIFSLF